MRLFAILSLAVTLVQAGVLLPKHDSDHLAERDATKRACTPGTYSCWVLTEPNGGPIIRSGIDICNALGEKQTTAICAEGNDCCRENNGQAWCVC